uniref:Uncharacterized protein n=1 Tax=Peronospora matthiolae TaxID=2874970 RepID=A0AAV1UDY2_9STRA
MRTLYIFALFICAILQVTADIDSTSQNPKTSTTPDSIRSGSVPVKRQLKDHVDDERDREDWLHPFDRLSAKLDHTRAKIRNVWSKIQPKKVLSRTINSLKQLPKKARMYAILHTIRSGKLDVRRTDEPGALFSNDFLGFVLHRHHKTMYSTPDDAMIRFLRMNLPEVEVAILISRAKLFEENAAHIEKALFRQWAAHKVSAKKLGEIFMEDSSWQVGDEVYVREITDAYQKYIKDLRRSGA